MEDLRSGHIEIAIRYGRGPFPGAASETLCTDTLIPVCSPRLGLSRPEDLRTTALIHIDGRTHPIPGPDWSRWCTQAGLTGVDTGVGPRFPDSMLAVQAAIAGQGVVIASRILVADALAAGLLAAPFRHALAGDAYHFVCLAELEQRQEIMALKRWLQDGLATT